MFKELTVEERRILEWHPAWQRANGMCPICDCVPILENSECEVNEYGQHKNWVQFRIYCMANIPLEFQVLDLNNFPYEDARTDFLAYVDAFPVTRWYGLGYEVYGRNRGVGKTYAATGILKGVINLGYTGFFMQFNDAKSLFEWPEDRKLIYTRRLRESEILVLDEILEPTQSEAQRRFFEERLEDIIRFRASNNLPTLLTTNLEEESMQHHYPRVASLLSAKQKRWTLRGEDHRPHAYERAVRRAEKGERLAIV